MGEDRIAVNEPTTLAWTIRDKSCVACGGPVSRWGSEPGGAEHDDCGLVRLIADLDRAEARVKEKEKALEALSQKSDAEHAELCRLGGACSKHQPAAGFVRAALKGAKP